MRQIKFRGKRKNTGEWAYGDLVRNVEGAFAIVPPFQMNMNNVCSNYEVRPESIGQFTGFLDKKGNQTRITKIKTMDNKELKISAYYDCLLKN